MELIASKTAMYLFAFFAVGMVLANAFFRIEKFGVILGKNWNQKIKLATLIWWMATFLYQVFETNQILNSRFTIDSVAIWSYLTQTDLGKSYLISLIFIFVSLLFNFKKTSSSYLALGAMMIALLSPIFQSHSSGLGNHGAAIGFLIFHVGAIVIWVGALIGWRQLDEAEKDLALPRLSILLLWVAITVVITGAVNSLIRLGYSNDWLTKYGFIVIAKVLLTFLLIILAYRNRRNLIDRKVNAVRYLVTIEIALLAVITFLGSWLSNIKPPNTASKIQVADPALSIVGINMPKTPTFNRVFWAYQADGVILGILIFAVALYVRGVLTLSRRGDKWPVSRTIFFAIGVSLVDFATSGGIGVYANFAFSFHMMAHMIIGMIAPIAIVLGAPITLALRTLPIGRIKDERGIRGIFIVFLHSPFAKIISNPVIALAIFDGSLFVLYFTNLFGDLMGAHVGHLFMNLHFLLAGILFFQVIIGTDPLPITVPHILKIVILFAAMSIHAFFSIGILSATTQLDGGYFQRLNRPWWTDYLADQKLGGSIGWALSEIPILLALIAVFLQWVKSDRNETRRIDRASERAAAMSEDDELARYNKYLARLSMQDNQIIEQSKEGKKPRKTGRSS